MDGLGSALLCDADQEGRWAASDLSGRAGPSASLTSRTQLSSCALLYGMYSHGYIKALEPDLRVPDGAGELTRHS